MKVNTIKRQAKELLDHDRITATIRQLRDELKETSDIKKRWVLFEFNCILEAKITAYLELKQVPVPRGQMDEDGIMSSALVFNDFSRLIEMLVRTIEYMKQTKYDIELKLHNKLVSIEHICKMLGFEARINLI